MTAPSIVRGDPYPCASCGAELRPLSYAVGRFAVHSRPEQCDHCAGRVSPEDRRRAAFDAAGVPTMHALWCFAGEYGPRPDFGRDVRSHVLERLRRTRLAPDRDRGAHVPRETRSAWICGPVGTGKSTLAAAILRTAVMRPESRQFETVETADGYATVRPVESGSIRSALWLSTGQLDSANLGRGSGAELVAKAKTTGLLVLDDIGEPCGPWTARTIAQIIRARYDAVGATLFTSNLDPAAAIARMVAAREGETDEEVGVNRQRLTSVIREMCGAPIVLDGEDRRAGR